MMQSYIILGLTRRRGAHPANVVESTLTVKTSHLAEVGHSRMSMH